MATRTVHVVFKTHLDVGFTDLAANVVRQYFASRSSRVPWPWLRLCARTRLAAALSGRRARGSSMSTWSRQGQPSADDGQSDRNGDIAYALPSPRRPRNER